MSSLLRRVAAATVHATPVTSKLPSKNKSKEEEEDVLIPLSTVAHHIATHPLVVAIGISTEEVHAAIVRLHAFCVGAQKEEKKPSQAKEEATDSRHTTDLEYTVDTSDLEDTTSNVQQMLQQMLQQTPQQTLQQTLQQMMPHGTHRFEPVSKQHCVECGVGVTTLDARNGNYVCSHCGLCSRQQVNVEPEYQAPPEVSCRGKRRRGPVGVPTWMVEKNRSVDQCDRRHSSYWDEIESFNQAFCHMGIDDLEEVDHLLRAWKATGGDTREARMVAALLYVRMRDLLPTEHDIRKQLRCHHPLERVDCGPPPPEFACETCDRKHHTKKGARFCRVVNRCG